MAVALLGSSSSFAQTPEDLLNKTASAAARASGLKIFCSRFYLVDLGKVEAVHDTLNLDGSRRFGPEIFSKKYYEYLSSYGSEVSKSGAAIWCPKQRAFYKRAGITDLIGGPLD